MFDEDTGTVFRDVITLALLGFVAVVLLLLPWINPPGSDASADVDAPGDVMFEASWPKELDTDVDVWVQAPNAVPVGYSNKGGIACNLLRDDLGRTADPLEVNYEIIVCRGIRTSGEYVMNLHLYRDMSQATPVAVSVKVSVRPAKGEPYEALRTKIELDNVGREATVVRFELDGRGRLVADSVHSLFKPLRAFGKTS